MPATRELASSGTGCETTPSRTMSDGKASSWSAAPVGSTVRMPDDWVVAGVTTTGAAGFDACAGFKVGFPLGFRAGLPAVVEGVVGDDDAGPGGAWLADCGRGSGSGMT